MFLKLFKTVTVDPKPLPKRFKTVAFLQNPDCFLAVRSVAVPWIDHEPSNHRQIQISAYTPPRRPPPTTVVIWYGEWWFKSGCKAVKVMVDDILSFWILPSVVAKGCCEIHI
ncbi:hypothetical protein P8452_08956 [Trifolium repens]|nr:hypothetical protein P8452_08956 [Trifolium repens]